MSNLSIFTFDRDFPVRAHDMNGVTWFVAADVAAVLQYRDPARAVRTHVAPEGRTTLSIETAGGQQQAVFIDEGGVFELIMRSKMERAVEFRRWVTSEVLPSIRKQGFYVAEAKHVDTEALEAALDEVKREKVLLLRKVEETKEAAIETVMRYHAHTPGVFVNSIQQTLEAWDVAKHSVGNARWHQIRADSAEQVLASLDLSKQSDRTRAILDWRRKMLDALARGKEDLPTKFYD